MKLNETTLADVLHMMIEDKSTCIDADFETNGLKARLEIRLLSRDEENL